MGQNVGLVLFWSASKLLTVDLLDFSLVLFHSYFIMVQKRKAENILSPSSI